MEDGGPQHSNVSEMRDTEQINMPRFSGEMQDRSRNDGKNSKQKRWDHGMKGGCARAACEGRLRMRTELLWGHRMNNDLATECLKIDDNSNSKRHSSGRLEEPVTMFAALLAQKTPQT